MQSLARVVEIKKKIEAFIKIVMIVHGRKLSYMIILLIKVVTYVQHHIARVRIKLYLLGCQ